MKGIRNVCSVGRIVKGVGVCDGRHGAVFDGEICVWSVAWKGKVVSGYG